MPTLKEIKTLNEEAWVLQVTDKTQGEKLAQQALGLAQAAQLKNEELFARLTLTQIANYQIRLDEAEAQLARMEAKINDTTPGKLVVRYHHQRCYHLYQKSQFAELIEAGHAMLECMGSDAYKVEHAWILATMGMGYQRLGNMNLALESYRQAEQRYLTTDDLSALSNVRMSMGAALAELGRKAEGLKMFQEALNVRLSVGGDFHSGIILGNMAKLQSQMGQHTKALLRWKEAIGYFENAGGMPLWAQAMGGMADTLRQLNRFAEAEEQINRGLSKIDNLPKPIQIELYLSRSRVYADAEKWNESVNSLKVAQLQMDEKTTGAMQRVELHNGFYLAYKNLGEIDLALQHHEQMVTHNQQHVNEKSLTKLAEWEALYQMEKLKSKEEKLRQKTAELETLYQTTAIEREQLHQKVASYEVLLKEMLEKVTDEHRGRFSQLLRAAQKNTVQENADELIQNRIAEKHADLTPTELRTCSMIVHGWSSKEMANRSGTSLKNIEKHRSAIRKKAAIPRSVSLQVYLTGLAKTD